MKTFFRNVHLYLGLATGAVIAVVCLTGALLVFEKEMQQWIYPERYFVAPGGARVPVERLVAALQEAVPGAKVASVRVHEAPGRSVEVSYGEGRGNMTQAFMNPYTGELITLYTHRNSFFYKVFALHRWLLLEDTGKMIVGVSTLVFLFILLTGLVLWWPRTWRAMRQRLVPRFDAGWKRMNHDLHVVVGFYAAVLLFAFAFTGLAWSFEWFNDGIYRVTGSPKKAPEPPASVVREGAVPLALDAALAAGRQQIPGADAYTVYRAKAPDEAVRVSALPPDAPHERAMTQLYLDQYTGGVLALRRFEDQSLGQRVRSTFYAIHVASIAGWPGRLLGLLACVAGFTFPITGVILWINRLRKKRRSRKGPATVAATRAARGPAPAVPSLPVEP